MHDYLLHLQFSWHHHEISLSLCPSLPPTLSEHSLVNDVMPSLSVTHLLSRCMKTNIKNYQTLSNNINPCSPRSAMYPFGIVHCGLQVSLVVLIFRSPMTGLKNSSLYFKHCRSNWYCCCSHHHHHHQAADMVHIWKSTGSWHKTESSAKYLSRI